MSTTNTKQEKQIKYEKKKKNQKVRGDHRISWLERSRPGDMEKNIHRGKTTPTFPEDTCRS